MATFVPIDNTKSCLYLSHFIIPASMCLILQRLEHLDGVSHHHEVAKLNWHLRRVNDGQQCWIETKSETYTHYTIYLNQCVVPQVI